MMLILLYISARQYDSNANSTSIVIAQLYSIVVEAGLFKIAFVME